MVLGQIPKAQIVLPGDFIQILIAHDMVALGLAHYGDGVGIHSRAPGEAVVKRSGSENRAGTDSQEKEEKHEYSCDYYHLVYFI